VSIEFHRDGPWDLPDGWVWARLGELGRWSGGGTPSKSNATFWTNGTVPWISPKDMKQDIVGDSPDRITTEAIAGSTTKLVPANSILMVVRSGILNHTFPVAVSDREVTINQDMRALIPFEGIDARYVSFVLKRLQRHILDECSKDGTTVASVETNRLEGILVPIAPAAEQRRIVARIDELFTEIADGETVLTRVRDDLDTWRRALLKAAVTGELTREWREINSSNETGRDVIERLRQAITTTVGSLARRIRRTAVQDDIDLAQLPELPDGWSWSRVGEIGHVTGGLTKNPDRASATQKLPYLRVANVQYGELDLANVHEIGVGDSELGRVLLRANDLLVVEGNGSVDQIGRCALWSGEIHRCVHQNHIIKVRFGDSKIAHWAFHWLMSPHGRQLVIRVASSTSGLHTLSISKIEALPIPVSPTAELEKILHVLAEEADDEGTIEVELEEANKSLSPLRQAVLKAAFEGRLVNQSPRDEPADQMLGLLGEQRNAASLRPNARRTRSAAVAAE
jgi:type I restriction enzyme S subunit